jgi:hypothetical protein
MVRPEERPEWREWVTPALLRNAPVHRWFVFPHSYTDELVQTLLGEWSVPRGASVLDPFAGAGTTAVTAQNSGMKALAFDLSPLAVLATRVKTSELSFEGARGSWIKLQKSVRRRKATSAPRYPELVERALPGKLLPAFHLIKTEIEQVSPDETRKDFFLLALLRVLPMFSRLIATGGWLSVRRGGRRATGLAGAFDGQVCLMLTDLKVRKRCKVPRARVEIADARTLPLADASVDAAITSPPYANRHDYTRVFGVELMFGLLGYEQTKRLRYQSFESHPEARPIRPASNGYCQPRGVGQLLRELEEKRADKRMPRMLKGYFADIYYALRELSRVLRKGGRAGIVIGNVQYSGVSFPVDEITAEIGEKAGLMIERLWVARYRGNSAQQMGSYGRKPARESVVIFRKI